MIVDRCQDQLANDQLEKLKGLLIDTKDEKPVKIPPRRVPLAQLKDVETEIQKMLANDIIQPSHSPWSTAIVVVKKATCIRFALTTGN